MDGLTVGREAFELLHYGGMMRHRVGMVGPSYSWTACSRPAAQMTPAAVRSARVIVCSPCFPAIDIVVKKRVPYYGAAGCRWCAKQATWELTANGRSVGYGCENHADKWTSEYI